MIKRLLDINRCNISFFLFGPRQVGKTWLLKDQLSPEIYINLLKQKEFLRYAKDPSLLSKEIDALPPNPIQVVIDEIQRCPELLNEIHLILEGEREVQFILTGSSARKLRRGGINLLGGRAITFHLHPLTHIELGKQFSLEESMRFGTLPKIALRNNLREKSRLLKSYVEIYLKEEIQQEALTRNIPAFARFLELAAFENGNLLNFTNLASDVGVHSKTIKEYFQILEDTLIGFFLFPYTRSHRKKLVSHPRFYFFDRGIVTALRNELSTDLIPGSFPYGNAFEHWVLVEMKRLLDYREREARMTFFRTADDAEVDIILEHKQEVWAIEIKSSSAPKSSDIRGLKNFIKDHSHHRAICVCQTPRPYKIDKIELLPWRQFLEQL